MKYKNSILAKVKRKTLAIAFCSASAVFILAAAVIFTISREIVLVSGELGNRVSADSSENISEIVCAALMDIADNKAEISDERFRTVAYDVEMLALEATLISSNPQDYRSGSIAAPNPENEGIATAQIIYSEDVSPETLAAEIGLIANHKRLQEQIVKTNPYISATQLGGASGFLMVVDENSASKPAFFDARNRPWYILATEQNRLIWTDVFDDAFGRGLAVTFAAPYYGADGEIMGAVGAGILLSNLNDVLIQSENGVSGRAFIVNEYGKVVVADSQILNENLLETDEASMRGAAMRMTAGERGIDAVIIDGQEYFIAYSPLKTLPWSLAVIIEMDEVLSPVYMEREHIDTYTKTAIGTIKKYIMLTFAVFAFVMTGVIAASAAAAGKLATEITAPVLTLSEGAKIIGGGNLDYALSVKTGDELEMLSETFNTMVRGIKDITAEKERIGAELNVAAHIQSSMLPRIFPAFSEYAEFDIYASMFPAKEVGGDFYDFFLVDEHTLAVVIADVSGKGVPAALFMVIAKTLIKNNAQYGKSPSEVFETVNNLLCEGNDAEMFVTAFMGCLDIPSGHFTYVNAGHNPPLIRRGGNFEWLKTEPVFILAGFGGVRYKQTETTLSHGDALYLYTDGVTEAENEDRILFGDGRLLTAARNIGEVSSKDFVCLLGRELEKFVGVAEQSDDITMLMLRVIGCEK